MIFPVPYLSLLLLSICTVKASLPYSIPDLEERGYDRIGATHHRIGHRAATGLSSFSTNPSRSVLGSSISFIGTASIRVSSTNTRDWTGTLPLHTSSSSSAKVASSGTVLLISTSSRRSLTGTPPFPSHSKSTVLGTESVGPSSGFSILPHPTITTSLTSQLLSISSSSTGTTPSNIVSSSSSASKPTSISLPSTRTILPGDVSTILTTVTASDGSPQIVTITVSASTMSDLPTAPEGFPFRSSNPPAQPTSSTVPVNNPLFSKFPPPHILDVVIDGETYHLPSSQQSDIKILLLDGTFAQLFPNKVLIRGQTLDIPADITASQEVSSGGQSVTAQPGDSQEPQSKDKDGGGGGGGGLFGALGGLIDAAGSAAGSLADVGTGALGLAGVTGSAAGGVAAGLVGTFGAASKNAGGLVASLNGVQKAFPVTDIAKTGLDSILQAQNLGRDAANWAKSMGKMVEGWDGLGADGQQQVKNNIQDYAGPDGPLKQAEQAMKAFSDFPWSEQDVPTQSPTGSKTPDASQTHIRTTLTQPTNSVSLQSSQGLSSTLRQTSTGTDASTRASTTSSASPTSTPSNTLVTYFLQTKSGTSLETFDKFIKDLDGGVGQSFTYDLELIDHQNYMTKLNSSQVASLEKGYDFILAYHPCVTDPIDLHSDEEFHAIPKASSSLPAYLDVPLDQPSKYFSNPLSGRRPVDIAPSSSADSFSHLSSRALNPPVPDAPYWLKMISSPPVDPLVSPSQDPPFLADESGGRGTTIYVIDDGFDIFSEDLAAEGRTVNTFVVENQLAFAPDFLDQLAVIYPNAKILEETIVRGKHGTKMATIAGGKIHGVAPNADLFLVKYKGQFNRGNPRNDVNNLNPGKELNNAVLPGAVARCLDIVRRDITIRLQSDPTAKSVINMSWGLLLKRQGSVAEPYIREFVQWSERQGGKVTVVLAAGNDEHIFLHDQVPHKLGTPTNNIITVGGVEKDGSFYTDTSPHKPGESGSMTVFAPARDVIVPGPGDGDTGTSQAAAIVSGLAAYFHSLPNLADFAREGSFLPGDAMKNIIATHAWSRILIPAGGLVVPSVPPISELKVVYNLAAGDPAHEGICLGKRAGQPQSSCQAPVSAASSTFAASKRSAHSSSAFSSLSTSSALPSATSAAPSSASTTSANTLIPTSVPTPQAEKCRINVAEFDDLNPDIHGNSTYSVNIYPDSKNTLSNDVAICFHGAEENEQTGIDIKCPPLGEGPLGMFNVRRDADDVLRFVWREQTWTGADKRCKLVEAWHPSAIDKTDRKRVTECVFNCYIDESKPPAYEITK